MHPLTFGQLSVARFIERTPGTPASTNLTMTVALPAGASVDDVQRRLVGLQARHESMRTTYRWGDGGPPGQIVHDLAQADLPETERIDVEYLHEPVRDHVAGSPFTLTDDFGWRATIGLARGVPESLTLVAHHIVADGWSIRTLKRELDLTTRLADRPLPTTSPRELAHVQRSSSWRSRRLAALRHWEQLATSGLMSAVDTAPTASPRLACTLPLGVIGPSIRAVAAECRVSPATVLLALTALEIAVRLDHRRFALWLMCANRSSPQLRSVVTSMNQRVPMMVTVDPSATARTFLQRTHLEALTAHSRGCYDLDEIGVHVTATIGGEPLVEYLYNYAVNDWPPDEPSRVMPVVPSGVDVSVRPAAARVYIVVSAGAAPSLQVHADEALLDQMAIVDYLCGLQVRLHRIRTSPNIPLGALART